MAMIIIVKTVLSMELYIVDIRQSLKESFKERFISDVESDYIPTGLQDEIIEAFGSDDYQFIFASHGNRVGKTTVAPNIIRAIFGYHKNSKYFPDKLYKNWKYPKDGLIAGTTANVKDDGAITKAIKQWFPSGILEPFRDGKTYNSRYVVDGKYTISVMTYEQHPTEWEGKQYGWVWLDEPPPPFSLGAVLSRMDKGGVVLNTATPLKCSVYVSRLDDLEEGGLSLKRLTGSVYDNSNETGKYNRLKTKRGLRTDKEIERWVQTVPANEVDARVYGKVSNKSGVIYNMFNRNVHIIKPDEPFGQMKKTWNYYMINDHHQKYYPFWMWVAVTPPPDTRVIVVNEFPNYEELGDFYDKARNTAQFPYTIEEASRIIKILDGNKLGFNILDRWIDPRANAGSERVVKGELDSFLTQFAKYDIDFSIPPFQNIAIQRDTIQKALHYDTTAELSPYNMPTLYFYENCVNTIRSVERHYYMEGKDKESEEYKDPMDCLRYFFAGIGEVKYIHPEDTVRRKSQYIEPAKDYLAYAKPISMG